MTLSLLFLSFLMCLQVPTILIFIFVGPRPDFKGLLTDPFKANKRLTGCLAVGLLIDLYFVSQLVTSL